jgi:signal transduction histidine kinase/DNA-binding response OmpR family regulator
VRAVENDIISSVMGGRGYVLTGDSANLRAFRNGAEAFPQHLAVFKQLTRDNESQQIRARLLDSLGNLRLAQIRSRVEARARDGVTAATSLANTVWATRTMTAINALTAAVEKEERALLTVRSRAVRREADRTVAVMAITFLFTLVIGLIVHMNLSRTVAQREAAEGAAHAAKASAEAASRAKSDFLARMSHELRTPLNSVIGFANVLKKNKGNNLREQDLLYVERIRANGNQLLALINTILDLSKIEAGRADIDISRVPIDRLIAEIEGQFEAQLADGTAQLRTIVPPGLLPLATDAAKLRQVILNLVSNALKFAPDGVVTIKVHGDPNSTAVRQIDVIDTGPGISSDRQQAIFEAFEQADSGIARKYGGTGLGLTISRSICQLLGYELRLASTVGEGSTFSIVIPISMQFTQLSPATPGRLWTPTSLPAVGPPVETRSRETLALVIDDEADSRMLLTQHMRELGCSVITAKDGVEGLTLAVERRPDIILLDLLMPDMNGWEVLRRLKDDPYLAKIPVVVVSIVAGENRAGVFSQIDAVTKPCTKEDLGAALERNLKGPYGRILVVDDDRDMQDLLSEALTRDAKVTVRTARDGVEGLKILREFHPNLVVLDLVMPRMDGPAFLEQIRSDPVHRNVPVVVLTARDLSTEEEQRLRAETQALLRKGPALDTAMAEISQILRGVITSAEKAPLS